MTDLAPGPGQLIYKPSGPGPVSPGDAQASVDGIVAFFFGTSGTTVNLGGGRIVPCLADLIAGLGAGGVRPGVRFVSTAQVQLLAADDQGTIVLTAAGDVAVSLPTAQQLAGLRAGYSVDIIQVVPSTHTVTVQVSGSDTLLSLSSDDTQRALFGHGAAATVRLLAQDASTAVRQWALIGALQSENLSPPVISQPPV